MEKHQDQLRLATIVLFCLLNIGFGLYGGKVPLMVGGALGMVYAASWARPGCSIRRRHWSRRRLPRCPSPQLRPPRSRPIRRT